MRTFGEEILLYEFCGVILLDSALSFNGRFDHLFIFINIYNKI